MTNQAPTTNNPMTETRWAFLTARWSNLVLLTYAVPRDALASYVPPGCDLDVREGSAFVSLVAFDFLETRVLGMSWPGYRNFPEINLRFYVRQGADRGVCFIREYVPRRLVAWIARRIYNEPYAVAQMASTVEERVTGIRVRHELGVGGTVNTVEVVAGKPAVVPAEDSTEHFFKEHSWGFGTSRRGALVRYRVDHPVWETYPVQSWKLDWNWAAVYGQRWGFLQEAKPMSVILARGSGVKVYPKA
jgi:uncharacterized protein